MIKLGVKLEQYVGTSYISSIKSESMKQISNFDICRAYLRIGVRRYVICFSI